MGHSLHEGAVGHAQFSQKVTVSLRKQSDTRPAAHRVRAAHNTENWTTKRYHDSIGTHAETKRFRVRVSGPLPGNPSDVGEFTMTVRRYGDRAGWWITPEEGTPATGRVPL